ncbi:hypothetical protein DSI41_17895, partial [Mycobacterium tuberculosis]
MADRSCSAIPFEPARTQNSSIDNCSGAFHGTQRHGSGSWRDGRHRRRSGSPVARCGLGGA